MSYIEKWFSRKMVISYVGLYLYRSLPLLHKELGISDNVTLASLGGITLIVGYYCKVNKDVKASGVVDGKPD